MFLWTKSSEYNIPFLGDSFSSTSNNTISQYLYFVNLDGEEERYNVPDCTGNFIGQTPGVSVDTGVSRFIFSNSLILSIYTM